MNVTGEVLLHSMRVTVAYVQGCAQCLDNTAATPPATQAAYRHAIILLASTAVLLFLSGIALLRKDR